MMASLKEIKNPHGQTRWRVNFEKDGVRMHKDHRAIEDACRHLYLAEVDRFADMSAEEKEKSRDWLLRKLVRFYFGLKVEQFELGKLRLSTLNMLKSLLFSLDESLMNKPAMKIRAGAFRELPELTRRYLNSAYLRLLKLRGIGCSPVAVGRKNKEGPIVVPAFENVASMIAAANPREKRAFILASELGLRISEILPLRYSDIQGDLLSVTRHLTPVGVEDGLKADPQRLLWVPDALIPLLDKRRLGTDTPLVAKENGEPLALSYSRNGVVKALLTQFNIGTFHNLRHFAAVQMLANGEDISFVSHVLGHRDIDTTNDIYGRFRSRVLQRKK